MQDENLNMSLGELAHTTRGIITIVTAVVALVGMAPFLFIEVRHKRLSIRSRCHTKLIDSAVKTDDNFKSAEGIVAAAALSSSKCYVFL